MVKITKHIVSENEITLFNTRREISKGKQFSAKEFKELLRKMNYADSGNFIAAITRGVNPPFVRVSRGVYQFSKEPVHIKRLQQVWDEYSNYGSSRNRKKSATTEEQIAQAIALLKENGYKVYKSIVRYEEV